MTDQMNREETLSVMSDLHKDARGFRPTIDFSAWTDEAIDHFFTDLVDELAANEAEEKVREKKAWAAWTKEISERASRLNITQADAIRFDMHAYDVDGDVRDGLLLPVCVSFVR